MAAFWTSRACAPWRRGIFQTKAGRRCPGLYGIDRRIDLFGPCDRSLRHLFGADLARGDEPGEGDGVVLAIFFEPHGLPISELQPVENDYSYNELATSYFIISVMLAYQRFRRDDDVSAQASHHRRRAAMQVSKVERDRSRCRQSLL